jgi:hypothetical protein
MDFGTGELTAPAKGLSGRPVVLQPGFCRANGRSISLSSTARPGPPLAPQVPAPTNRYNPGSMSTNDRKRQQ